MTRVAIAKGKRRTTGKRRRMGRFVRRLATRWPKACYHCHVSCLSATRDSNAPASVDVGVGCRRQMAARIPRVGFILHVASTPLVDSFDSYNATMLPSLVRQFCISFVQSGTFPPDLRRPGRRAALAEGCGRRPRRPALAVIHRSERLLLICIQLDAHYASALL